MSIADTIQTVGSILGALSPVLTRALDGGTPADILTHALLATAEEVAVRRVEARADKPTPQLAVEALRLEDAAKRIRALGETAAAGLIEAVADDFRDRAAATADTEPPA